MLLHFTRRVALPVHRSAATYTGTLLSFTSPIHSRRILDDSLRSSTVQSFANPQRNFSTEVTATANNAKSTTTGRKNSGNKSAPEQEVAQTESPQGKKRKKASDTTAALKAKLKAQAEREKERQKVKEAKKPKIIKPPPRTIGPFSLFIQDMKKPMQECTADWRSLSEEKKQEYAARAKAMSEKRKEEYDAFLKSATPLEIRDYNRHQRSTGRRVLRVKRNSRPLSSFFRYVQEFRTRPDQAGRRPVEVAKAAGEAWRSFTQEEKDKYKPIPSESTIA